MTAASNMTVLGHIVFQVRTVRLVCVSNIMTVKSFRTKWHASEAGVAAFLDLSCSEWPKK